MFWTKTKDKKHDEARTKERRATKADPMLIKAIEPAGGITFKEQYAITGNGYEACLHVTRYPRNVNKYWLEPLLNIRVDGVTTHVDIAPSDRDAELDAIGKSVEEQLSRYVTEKRERNKMDAQNDYNELRTMYEQLVEGGEEILYVKIRYYVAARTLKELEEKIRLVEEEVRARGCRATLLIEEQEAEFMAIGRDALAQERELYNGRVRKGQPIPSLTFAAGYPFYYRHLDDPRGSYLGDTYTNGPVLFDLFHKDPAQGRNSYCFMAAGVQGVGKSTLLKKLLSMTAMNGGKVRVLDPTTPGEFTGLADHFGGLRIPLDGSMGLINPFEIMATAARDVEDDGDGSIDELNSYLTHIDRLTEWYALLNPRLTDDHELHVFGVFTDRFYQACGLSPESGQVTRLPATQYPTLSDFHDYLGHELGTTRNDQERVALERIHVALETLVGKPDFDGHTSFPDITDHPFVVFGTAGIVNRRANVQAAQLYLLSNFLWGEMLTNGAPQFKAFNDGELALEDVVPYLFLIDEAHLYLNDKPENRRLIQLIENFVRQSRKYFGGVGYATQSINDLKGAHLSKLFELTQYKMIFKHDASSAAGIRESFAGQFSEAEVEAIRSFGEGEMLLAITGGETIRMRVQVSREELARFGGGA
ncbi:putative Conjugal transfer ATP-binding protein TraC [Exiguobacterium sp. 8H]|uniref:VirB4 family type IV secretion system protein n=1 Tax=unclassified Exiguobacterium TaxID=2644629 RepID=UPI0012EFC9CB|nr:MULTISPECIES: hypothetical protein [unclassified Exiguobacterium]VXB98169.1 putative Conjugal transfer ATP-binding protein TraC [Exiguobacterium sp. 8A]VXC14132.1 putative Conjugal transfer ATP-binding protein TraC [Exiguobacterium sp. 8H]